MKSCLLVFIISLVHAAGQSAQSPARTESPRSMDQLDARQKLGTGDRLTFQVLEDREPPKALAVSETGEIHIQYLGLVQASGKTCRQLAHEIKALLEKDLYYRATVLVTLEQSNHARTSGKVYVSGQVRQVGPQEIPSDEAFTVSKAILHAGGFSEFSDRKRVRLTRRIDETRKQVWIVNVVEVLEDGKIENDPIVQPGDMIFVPARLLNF